MTRRRKGVSTIIGAAIFIGILVLAFSSLQFFMKDLSALSDSFTQMSMVDEDRRKEVLVIDKIALAQLSSQTATITSPSPTTGATLYPVNNMNFTDNADGWIFSADLYNPQTPPATPVTLTQNADEDNDGSTNDDRDLNPPNNNGVLPQGGFTGGRSGTAVPSQSGAGSIYTYFSFISSSSNDEAGALLKWTYKFSLDSATAAAITNTNTVFSIGYYVPYAEDVKGPAQNDNAIIFYTLTSPSGTTYPIEIEQLKDEIAWNHKEILATRVKDSGNNPITWAAGDYKLQITVMVDIKANQPSSNKVSELKVHFDDVGIKLNLPTSGRSFKLHSYDLDNNGSKDAVGQYKFNIASTDTTSSLDFSIQASSNVAAQQYVFLYDFARSKWTLLLTSSVSSSTSNVKLTEQSLDVPRFVALDTSSYTVDPGTNVQAAVGDVWIRILVSAASTSLTSYSATLSLDTQIIQNNTVSFVVSNTGGVTAHIVRYWIVTGAETKSVDVDTYLDPGKSTTLSQSIIPTTGAIEVRIITDRGSVIAFKDTI